ncbi:hypothetical protein MJ391_08640 [Escherichia coli]|nr:hypothetical protein MJ391_08640 [Escherichia coli]
MPQLKTPTALLFSTSTKENPAYLTAPIAKEKSVKHCGGCKDQGVRSLALSPDEKLIYATSFEANALSVINVQGEIIQSITTGAHPDSLILSRDGTKAWVMNRTSIVCQPLIRWLISMWRISRWEEIRRRRATSGKPGAWVMALSPDERTLLVPGEGRGNIVRINTITHQKEDFFPQVMRVERYRRCVFDLKNHEVIFADSLGDFTYKHRDQQTSIMTQWCSRSVYSVGRY